MPREVRELRSWRGELENLVTFCIDWTDAFMLRDEIIDLVRKVCGPLDPALVCAIIEQESNFDPWAIRYEPAFFEKYVAPISGLNITEMHGRAFSWGLMQTMGQVAREVGYKGPFPQLCSPETGITVGCEVFSRKMLAAHSDVHQALLYWNGGANLAYPASVMSRISKFA